MSALLSLYNVAHFFAFSCSNVRLFVVAFFSSSLVQWTEVDVSSRSTTDHRKLCLLLDSIRKTSLPGQLHHVLSPATTANTFGTPSSAPSGRMHAVLSGSRCRIKHAPLNTARIWLGERTHTLGQWGVPCYSRESVCVSTAQQRSLLSSGFFPAMYYLQSSPLLSSSVDRRFAIRCA
jgi:hypothetical protein